jgi:hypothetical protein
LARFSGYETSKAFVSLHYGDRVSRTRESICDRSVNEGETLSFVITAGEPEGDSLTITGDIDGDCDLDTDDMNIIMAARNTPADGDDDPRDLDGDGTITANDARQLSLLCTRPRCATE